MTDLSAGQLVAMAAHGCTLAWISLEVGWHATRAASPQRRALVVRVRTGAAMAAGALVVGFAYTALLRGAWSLVGRSAPHALVEFWHAHAVLAAVGAFVAWDAVGFAYHWLGHRTRIGWAAHRPHHTGDVFDITLALRQTWVPVHGLLCQPFLALGGFDFGTIVVCAAVSNAWQALQHSSVLPSPAWLTRLVMSPAAHRHHHGTDAPAVNLGAVFTIWDRIAGTWLPADTPPPARYGVASRGGVFAIEAAGWRALVGRGAAR